MNSAGLIVIAIFGGALLVLLLVGMLVLGWVLWQVKAAVAEHSKLLESSKTQFAAIHADMARQQEQFAKDTHAVLQTHANAIGIIVGKINGDVLAEASVRAVNACARMEKMAVAVEKLLLTVDTAPESNLDPEAYGPTDTIYGTVSDVARGDREAEAEESQDTLSFR